MHLSTLPLLAPLAHAIDIRFMNNCDNGWNAVCTNIAPDTCCSIAGSTRWVNFVAVPKGWSIWQAVYDKENCDRNSAYRPFQSAGGCIDWNARSAKYSFNRITRREEVEGGMAKREEEGEGCVSPDTLVLGNGTRYDMQDLTVGEVIEQGNNGTLPAAMEELGLPRIGRE